MDEAQLLPPEFLQPITDVINLLATHYGVTFLFSTATQPKLASFEICGQKPFRGLDNVCEIIEDPDALCAALKRVEVEIPSDLYKPRDWDSLAAELAQYPIMLCIVNRRDDARLLHRLMPKGTLHLSALMCGEHRSRVIAEIKSLLSRHESVRVISTQLVEAGVDLDFPVVYRALAGLDSIAQAAGRCNREGKLKGLGRVIIFVPPTSAPPGLLRQAAQISVSLMAGLEEDLLGRIVVQRFFEHLYVRAPSLDKHSITDLLSRDARRAQIQFRTVAQKFKLIDDKYQTILVRYGKSDELLELLSRIGPTRDLMRKLQRYAVNIPARLFVHLAKTGDVYPIHSGIYAQVGNKLYDETLGVITDGEIAPDDLVV
jgi:CRISPR-associated endonuclease/helicase Cas3